MSIPAALLVFASLACFLGAEAALVAAPPTAPYPDFLYERITKRVKVWNHASAHHPRLLCFVMTTAKRTEQATTSFTTWGQRCDHFVAFTDLPQAHMEEWMHPYPGFLREFKHNKSEATPRFETEDADVSMQKIAATWQYVQEEYGNLAEYFFMGYDDTYVIVENLRRLLVTMSVSGPVDPTQQPLFIGRRFKYTGSSPSLNGLTFNLGAAGYALNRRALDALATGIVTRSCDSETSEYYADMFVANCLKQNSIFPMDTRDESGAERFHPLAPREMFDSAKPDWYTKAVADYSPKDGEEGVSKETITFHDLPSTIMAALDKALYADLNAAIAATEAKSSVPPKSQLPWAKPAGTMAQPPAGWAEADKAAAQKTSSKSPGKASTPEKTSAPSTPALAASTTPVPAASSGSASSSMSAGASSAPAAGSMKPASSSGGDWHDRFSKTQRDMVRDRMHTVLLASGKARHGVDDSSATPLFNKYEDHVYSTASSLHDYYEKIAEKMVEVKASSGAASSSASTLGNSGSSSKSLLGSRSASGASK